MEIKKIKVRVRVRVRVRAKPCLGESGHEI